MPISDGTMVGLAGVVMVFLALLIGYVSVFLGRSPTVVGLFFLLLFIGMIVLFISSYMMRKEREKALHSC